MGQACALYNIWENYQKILIILIKFMYLMRFGAVCLWYTHTDAKVFLLYLTAIPRPTLKQKIIHKNFVSFWPFYSAEFDPSWA